MCIEKASAKYRGYIQEHNKVTSPDDTYTIARNKLFSNNFLKHLVTGRNTAIVFSYKEQQTKEFTMEKQTLNGLTRKTFTTEDAGGCEFKCTVFSEYAYGERISREYQDCHGFGLKTSTLEEMKQKMSEQ